MNPAPTELVVTVPTDYPTLQAAIDTHADIPRGHTVTINIAAGHRPASGITVQDGDYSMFRITATDPVAHVADTFTGHFIAANRARAPRLGTLVDMADRGGTGSHLVENSTGFVEQRCGVLNAGGRGLYIAGNSSCYALRSTFTGSNDRNVWVTRASNLDAEESNFSANKGGENAVYVSRASRANIQSAQITDAHQNALTCTRSQVSASHSDLSRAGLRGLVCDGQAEVKSATITGCGSHGIYAEQGSIVAAQDATVTGNGGNGVHAQTSSTVDARRCVITGNQGRDLHVALGSFINANDTRTSSSPPGTTAPQVADANVSAFDALTREGVIWSSHL